MTFILYFSSNVLFSSQKISYKTLVDAINIAKYTCTIACWGVCMNFPESYAFAKLYESVLQRTSYSLATCVFNLSFFLHFIRSVFWIMIEYLPYLNRISLRNTTITCKLRQSAFYDFNYHKSIRSTVEGTTKTCVELRHNQRNLYWLRPDQ